MRQISWEWDREVSRNTAFVCTPASVMLLSRIRFEKGSASRGHTFGSAGAVRTQGGWLSHGGELFGQTLCGGRWQTWQEIHRHLKICGIGSIAPLINKCRDEGKVQERIVEEKDREHTRIVHSQTMMLKAIRDKNIGAVTHWEWTHITGCEMRKRTARAHATDSQK